MKFKCTGCGGCCNRIDRLMADFKTAGFDLSDKSSKLYFPYTHNENGRCENLLEDNKCKVYDKRPLVCNVSEFAKEFNLKKKEWFIHNYESCNKIMDEDNINLKFRIKI